MLCAGHEAIEYFNGLPLAANGIQPAGPLQEGNNEAEWIVDLTTRADREGRSGTVLLWQGLMGFSLLCVATILDMGTSCPLLRSPQLPA